MTQTIEATQARRRVSLLLTFILIYSVMSLLAGCGFRLRGSIDLPPELTQVVVEGIRTNSELAIAVRNGFARAGGEVVALSANPRSVLVITQDSTSRRVLSVDSIGQANEYEVAYTLGFRLDDPDGVNRVVQQSVSLRRQYRYDPNLTLAKADEEARLVREMRQDAVRQMMRRLKAGIENPLPPEPKAETSAPAP